MIESAEEFSKKYEITEVHGQFSGMINYCEIFNFAKDYAKLHVEAALKTASEDAKMDWDSWFRKMSINKSSILNAYPLTNIK